MVAEPSRAFRFVLCAPQPVRRFQNPCRSGLIRLFSRWIHTSRPKRNSRSSRRLTRDGNGIRWTTGGSASCAIAHHRPADRGAAGCQRAMLRALPHRRLPVCPGRLVLSGERRRNFETRHARNSRCEHLGLKSGNRRAANLRRRMWSRLRSLNEALLAKPVHAALRGLRRRLEDWGGRTRTGLRSNCASRAIKATRAFSALDFSCRVESLMLAALI